MKLSEKELEVVEILEKDARISSEDVAKMIGLSLQETDELIKKLEKKKVLVHYTTVVDWSKIDGHEGVTAMIDVKVTPKRGVGLMK